MKRTREASFGSDDGEDNAFDDGDDLMARAADMVDFDDEEDSGSSGDDDDDGGESSGSASGSGELDEPNGKHANGQKKKSKRSLKGKERALDPVMLDDEAEIRSALQMQIDALVSSVRCPLPSSSKARPLKAFLDQLEQIIKATPSRPPVPAQEAVRQFGSSYAFSDENTDLQAAKWQIGYAPPASIQLGGSWSLGTCCKWKGKRGWNVDLLAEMPSILFQEKDVKDSRYFYKRAYFVAVLADALRKSDLPVEVDIIYQGRNRRKPIIELRATGDKSELDFSSLRCVVRVLPVFNATTFPAPSNRLHPSRNNIRIIDSFNTSSEFATPIYNSDIASDGSPLSIQAYLRQVAAASSSFPDAALLLKVWTLQRDLRSLVGLEHVGLLLTLLLAYQVGGAASALRQMPAGIGSWQMLKGCLDALAYSDFSKRPVVAKTVVRATKAPSEEDWLSAGVPVVTDPTGTANLLAGVPKASLDALRYNAELSLGHLRNNGDIAFRQCFLTPASEPHLRFDHTAQIRLPTSTARISAIAKADASSSRAAVLAKISDVLERALSDRVQAISIRETGSEATVDIGLIMAPSQAARVVEYGPPAEERDECQAFRAFWGEKAETRRFKDGRILESVVWDASGPAERVLIFKQIMQHVLQRHLAISQADISFFAGAYDKLLVEPAHLRKALYTSDPVEAGFSTIMAEYNTLVKQLKELKGLPLAITNVAPVSEGLRYSSVFVPGPAKIKSLPFVSTAANYLPIHECLLTFEGSGKWPDDLEAIQKVKAAFLTRIGEQMKDAVPGTQASVSLDVAAGMASDNCALEIITSSGFAFRFRVHHARERTLIEDALLDDEAEEDSRKQMQGRLVAHHRSFTALPTHHAAISALQHRHTSFSSTVRIFKRWIAGHMLAAHIPAELLELVCAKVYLDAKSPYDVPASGGAGFARALAVLANWDWREEPLAVPLYTSPNVEIAHSKPVFPEEKLAQARKVFKASRAADPGMVRGAWSIVTEEDLAGRVLGQQKPGKLVAARLRELARACLASLEKGVIAGEEAVEHLFATPTDAFDFVLHLDPSRVPRHRQALSPNQKALAARPASPTVIRPGFDPVDTYLKRVEMAFGDSLALFYDPYGGTPICGLFNPALAAKHREFRITLDFPTLPVVQGVAKTADANGQGKEKAQVTVDRAALLMRLVNMGDGLVRKITTKEPL